MEKCNDFREQLSLYIDDMLGSDERLLVDQHIKACPECRGELEALKRLVEVCRDLEEKEPPEHLTPMIMSRLRKEAWRAAARSNRPLWRNPKFTGAAAAVILVLVLVKGVLPDMQSGLMGKKTASDSAGSMPAESQEYGGATPELDYDKAAKFAGDRGMGESFNIAQVDDVEAGGERQKQSPAATDGKLLSTGMDETPGDARKIIKNANLSLDVDNFDESFNAIRKATEQSGGFIENSNIYVRKPRTAEDSREYKEGHITLRIPFSEFNRVIEDVSGLGKVMNESVSGSDVTRQYMDTQARLRSKEVQEERLLDILGKASKVEDILRIENELNRVRTEIEMYTSQIRDWDNLVQYSTVGIFMREVEPKDKQVSPIKVRNIWDRVKSGFIRTTNGLLDLAAAVVVGIGYALPVIIVLGFGYMAWIRFRKRKNM